MFCPSNLYPKQMARLEPLLPRVFGLPACRATGFTKPAFIPRPASWPAWCSWSYFYFCVQCLRAGEVVGFLLLLGGEERRRK